MKTLNLTQNRDRNYPINGRIRAFHSAISKTKFNIQDVISSNSFNQFLISNSSWMRK